MTDVTCDQAREMISARIDGELNAPDEARLDAHTADCGACAAFEDRSFSLRRSLRMRAVEPESEPADQPAVDLIGSLRGVSALRTALFVIGGTLVILNLASILSPDSGAAAHLSRHDGIFGTALGIGMLAVAGKPHRAIGLVPLTSTIAVLMALAAGADLWNGQANLLAEAVHVIEFGGLLCLWIISGGPSRIPRHVAALTKRIPTFSPVSRFSRIQPSADPAVQLP